MANVDPLTIKELLGHSELKTTQIYMHLAENHKRSAVNVLDFSGTHKPAIGNTMVKRMYMGMND